MNYANVAISDERSAARFLHVDYDHPSWSDALPHVCPRGAVGTFEIGY